MILFNSFHCAGISCFEQQFQMHYAHYTVLCAVLWFSESPRTLTHLCRLRIRRCFMSQQLLIDDAILSLPLPTTILDYLLYNQSA